VVLDSTIRGPMRDTAQFPEIVSLPTGPPCISRFPSADANAYATNSRAILYTAAARWSGDEERLVTTSSTT